MQLQEQFEQQYNRLNEQQKKAVDTIEGPVMVIAGPGTGKTQILGARIGKILLDTDTQPESILCLTYTDAGVVAMRKRLLGFIGPDAYRVNIYTFHAFCNDIIQENLSLFEKTSLDAISDLEKIALFKELIDGFPKNHPLKRYRGDVYFEIRNLQGLFSTMKREGWTPAFITQKIDEYLTDLPNREEFVYQRAYKQFRKGDLKENKIIEAKEKMEKLRAAVNEFDRFQQLMRKRNRYDFDDMINWVIKAFEENKTLLARYQEQFLYILVDEYQDTSGTQNRLVELLINYWEHPNIFVVGDDDQSIYRFQGANVENMEAFADSYRNSLLTIVLTNNYRSTQPILDISKSLIESNQERLVRKIDGLSKDLIASHPEIAPLLHHPQIKVYETQREELIDITLQTEKLLQQGVQPGEIGIIYRENRFGEDLAQYFAQRNIPVFSKRNLDLLQLPLTQQIILLLKYLAAEHDTPYGGDEMLFEILHFGWFHIKPIEIAKLSVAVASKRFGEDRTSLRKALYEKINAAPANLFSQGPPAGMKEAGTALEHLIAAVPNLTLLNLFETCIREAGILSWIMQSPEKHFHLRVVTALFDFIKDEARRTPSLTLDKLVTLFLLMEDEGLALPMVQVNGSEKGVNLLTVHGSKGLEFQHVFMAGCNAGNWEKKRKPGGGYSFPDTMFDSQPKTSDTEELRRLFYVGLTRAQQHLHISYSRFKNDGKEWEASMFVAEIQQAHQLPAIAVPVTAEVLADFAMIQFSRPQSPELERVEADFITQLLDKFVMNVTALSNYLKCPLQFYFQNLVRVPSGKSEAAEFGSAVHHALERLFGKMQQTETFPPGEEFILDFEWYMHRHRENFTREQFARRMEYGHEVLKNYYAQYIGQWNRIVAVEKNVRSVVQGVPIKGKMDKLEFDGKSVNVVDYKTGDIDKAKDKLSGPSEKIPNGGDYWRQAVFYKILIDNYEQKQWKVVSTEFDFVEPDKKKNYRKEKIFITPQDITTVTEQIKMVWQKIQDRDFYHGCGEPDCHWCGFVKTNQLAIALHDIDDTEGSGEA
jgi:DNA helicase-2/ATP-dependent DNA helicase PcrA